MAGNRSITVTLRANVADFKNQFDAATKAAEQTTKATEDSAKRSQTAMGQMVRSAQDNRQAWTTAGATLTGFGAAALGGLGLATKAAMDWESSWAGVQKTVDGTAPQMAELEAGLRGLARELPASHQEIAAVAEAAGQLGIETPNVLGFTRTMIDMGEATNLSAEEAATSLARFMNVMGTSQTDVGRLGASVVGLGNNFATTESEIVQMAQRLSGAGAQAGLTEGDVLGMAAAMSSVGIEAEAGGSAMSQTMKRIGKAVDEGGASLDLFAQVSGLTAEQFSTAWNDNPAMALDSFINGLSGVESQGMTTNGVLTELGITGIRESDALLRLSAASGQGADGMSLLAGAVQQGNDEFEKGSALIEEAAKRYETAESKIAMAKNSLVDAGISIGGVFLPVVADVADRVADMAGAFADLPGPVHGAVGALGGIAGTGALAAGAFLLIFPRVMDTVQAFKTLKADNAAVASGLGKVAAAAGVAAGAFAVLNVASSVTESFRDGAEQAELVAAQLLNVSQSGDITAESINGLVSSTVPFGVSVRGVGDALDLIDTDPISAGVEGLTKTLLGVPTTVDVATESLTSLDGALTQLVGGGFLEEFSQSFAEAVKDAEAYGYTAEDLIAQMPGLREVLTPIATEMGLQADNATLAKIAMEGLDPAVVSAASGMEDGAAAASELEEELSGVEQAATDAAAATEDYYKSLRDLSNEFITAERAAMDYKESLKEAGKAVDENGKHWEDGTKAADANKVALLDLADQALKTADSLSAEGKSGTFLEKAREDLIDVATEMTGSKELAEEYVDQLLGTPEEIETLVKLETDQAKADWAALWDDLGYNPPEVPISADTAPAEGEWDEFTTGILSEEPPEVPVDADTSGAQEEVTIWGSQVGDVYTAPVPVAADIEPASNEVNRLALAVNSAGGTITINGNTVPADASLDTIMGIINNSDGTVTIDGTTYPADEALDAAIEAINRSGGTVTIDGNNDPANSATDSAKGHADNSTGTIDVDAATGGAESDITDTARPRSSHITASASTGSANSAINNAARPRTAVISVMQKFVGGSASGSATIKKAAGGAVHGPGTGTSDSIPAMLSNNEHVFTANEVSRAGGHQAVYSLRQQLLAGAKTLHLATGGGVENGSVAPVQYAPAYQQAPPQQSGPSTLTLDGAALGALADAVRTGASQATLTMSDRVAASTYQRGASASRAYGGKK
ncbi:phage tail tape measure protein [Brachybacterium sp. AOP3-A1-3]|uniref:phage tail tape measure protein n=1 Tax=Brachybacterium sp. AOP3-A1-3 TaxID=3457699 RepID=UPI004034DB6F